MVAGFKLLSLLKIAVNKNNIKKKTVSHIDFLQRRDGQFQKPGESNYHSQ